MDDLEHQGDGRVFGDWTRLSLHILWADSLFTQRLTFNQELVLTRRQPQEETKTEILETSVGRVLFNRFCL
jgi:uncharacterized damage-inducible protein DinB